MLDFLYIHEVQVIRWGKSQDSFGNMANSASSFIPSNSTATSWNGYLKCRIEEYNPETQYRQSGERYKNATLIYWPPDNPILVLQDEIYRDGVSIGILIGINPALKAGTTDLDHYEYLIENP